jgi:hypothetical protein
MPLATSADVLRVLRLDSVSAADSTRIDKALETAESWAKRYLKWPSLGQTGTVTDTFYHVNNVPVPPDATLLSVSILRYPGATPEVVPVANYELGNGRLELLSENFLWPGLPEDELREAQRSPYSLTITYTAGTVDPVIRDGVALAAASLWYRSPRLGKGLQGESIGDYSYSVAALQNGDPFYEQAKSMLRPLRRHGDLVPK